jgi:hypothetical protein
MVITLYNRDNMSDSLAALLANKNFGEPAEIEVIKHFLKDNYNAECRVTIGPRQIIILVNGAALAGALRMRLHELQALCQTEKRLVIRIT